MFFGRHRRTRFGSLIAIALVCAIFPADYVLAKSLGKRIKQGIKDIGRAPGSITRCVGDLSDCARRLPAAALWPAIASYKEHLFNQGRPRAQALPPELIRFAQPHYPEINLQAVRYATGINTMHGQAITWGNFIFFPGNWDMRNDADLRLMLHELEHVVQYQRRGGEKEFLSEYLLKSAGKVIQRGSFNVHDFHDMERAADRKADRLFAEARNSLAPPPSYGMAPGPMRAPQAYSPPGPMLVSHCVTNAGYCALNVPQPMNSQCGCLGPYGPIGGIAR